MTKNIGIIYLRLIMYQTLENSFLTENVPELTENVLDL